MRSPVVAALAMVAAASTAPSNSWAANTPQILIGKGNTVPACVTPEHLMAFMQARNKALPAKFKDIASAYKRHGEELHVRWDYAFYQMLVETNYLKFVAGGGKQGDVSPSQNNFAGLGATGHRAPGESFPNVDTGVLAHLQHVRLYSGDPVENPVAERTKLVTDLILPWAQSLKHPVTFTDLTHKWAPSGHSYADAIEGTADLYRQAFCTGAAADEQTAGADEAADAPTAAPAMPKVKTSVKLAAATLKATEPAAPEDASADDTGTDSSAQATLAGPALKKSAKVALATKITAPVAKAPNVDGDGQPDGADAEAAPAEGATSTLADATPVKKVPASKLAVAATVIASTADAASEGTDVANSSEDGDGGAVEVTAPALKTPVVKTPVVKLEAGTLGKLAKKPVVTASSADAAVKTGAKAVAKQATLEAADTGAMTTMTTTEDAASNTQLASLTVPANPAPAKNCKVFTASYGGGKSLLIQSLEGDHTRFTALTVNEAKADAQARAFINVYAKGGQKIAEFGTQNEALTKAFQLCPEG